MELMDMFPRDEKGFWRNLFQNAKAMEEVRMRVGQPTFAYLRGEEFFVGEDGRIGGSGKNAKRFSERELAGILLHLCKYSLYAYEDEMKEGYLTLEGGHRMGLTGQVALDHGSIQTIKHVSSLNLRIANQVKGAANPILPFAYKNGVLQSILIISPPGCGKTTMLRDLVRQVSDGNSLERGRNVSVVDERSEIGGSHAGITQIDLGMRTDVTCGCPKALGMRMMIRSFAPDVLAVDELGKQEDLLEIREAKRCGVKLFATLHGNGREDVTERGLNNLFDVFVLLEKGKPAPRIGKVWTKEVTK